MAIIKNLEKLLKDAKAKYEVVKHKTVYTALDKAKTLKISPKEVVKTLVLKLGSGHPTRQAGKASQYVLASIPADKNFDKEKFKKLFNDWAKKAAKAEGRIFQVAKQIDFAEEKWIKKNIFKTKAGGAVPPFGSMFKFLAFIDKSLLKAKKLVINAGGFEESIKLAGSQLEKIEKPVKGSFSKKKL
ncbi:YbaK/EbsC family protein [Patescibacteria group bacterium]|nr:YbaK/EbsC family protein [Patescibacteria group bacterium]MBU4056578.1 YbaK/EbsC family protein [Patescibacteria group bacterium]MBU4368382.1 YbaK/EbsC family protein [Patescibacteria group bacterium]